MLDRDPAVDGSTVAAQPTQAGEPGEPVAEPDEERQEPAPDASSARHVSASALPLNPMRPNREGASQAAGNATDSSIPPADALDEQSGPPLSALELRLLEDSWVEIHDAEGTRLEYDLLRSGQTLSYEGLAPFRLLVGRSSAVSLQVNGQPVTWEGHESGDVAEIAIAADGGVQR